MTRTLLFAFFLALSANISAQDFGYGFKAGLNFNSFSGDGETDDAGNTVEEYTGNTGFHLGVSFTWKATDLMGVRGELMYSQKGSRRSFDGQSYYIFNTNGAGERVATVGVRDQDINLTTSNIDIPVTAYFKPLPSLEVYAGASVGFLVAATGFGAITYQGTAPNGASIEEFVYDIDANYVSDDFGEAEFSELIPPVTVGNDNADIPRNAGAYYEYETDRGNLYKIMDFGLVGGLSFYLSKGLYVSGRFNYGLTDITKTEADVSLVNLDDNSQFTTRDDDDRNISIQVSVGFAF